MPNTAIEYLYRDASNYKSWNHAVLPGTVDDAQNKEIFECCDCGEFFIPEQVGLDADRLDDFERNDDDHLWCELISISATEEVPTVDLPAQVLYRRFLNAKGRWNPLMLQFGDVYAFDDSSLKSAKDVWKTSAGRVDAVKGIHL